MMKQVVAKPYIVNEVFFNNDSYIYRKVRSVVHEKQSKREQKESHRELESIRFRERKWSLLQPMRSTDLGDWDRYCRMEFMLYLFDGRS